jgi:hypothetical protein
MTWVICLVNSPFLPSSVFHILLGEGNSLSSGNFIMGVF